MTIVEAMRRSRDNYARAAGEMLHPSFMRKYPGPRNGYPGSVRYDEHHRYRDLPAEDLMADDWEFLDSCVMSPPVDCETGRVA